MTGHNGAQNFNKSNAIAAQADSCLCMMERCIGVPFFNCSNFASLFPEGFLFLDCLRLAVKASFACLQFIKRKRPLLLEGVKKLD